MKHRARSSPSRHRSGLAPVELVLVLPILAMLMALMINFGVAAAWKIRTQGNAHYAAFRSVQTRSGQWNAAPANWPRAMLRPDAGSGPEVGAGLPTVNQLWDANIDTAHPRSDWIRGEWFGDPRQQTANGFNVVKDRLEFDGSVITGRAQVERPLPMLRGALTNGRFRFEVTNDLLDNRWQYHTLGFSHNEDLRTQTWWAIKDEDLDPQRVAQLEMAQAQLQNLRMYLDTLDRDIEFSIYGRRGIPEFHQELSDGCTLDANNVQITQAQPLIDRINYVPCSMSHEYLGLYREWIGRLERCGADDDIIDPLRERYNDLQSFVNAMPRDECPLAPPLVPHEPCDPMDTQCFIDNECPAPTPDDDGL